MEYSLESIMAVGTGMVSRENVEEQDNTTVNYDGYSDGLDMDITRTSEQLHFADTYFKLQDMHSSEKLRMIKKINTAYNGKTIGNTNVANSVESFCNNAMSVEGIGDFFKKVIEQICLFFQNLFKHIKNFIMWLGSKIQNLILNAKNAFMKLRNRKIDSAKKEKLLNIVKNNKSNESLDHSLEYNGDDKEFYTKNLMSNVKEVPFDNQTNIQSFIIENIGKELYEHFDVLKKNIGKLNSLLEKNIIKAISGSSCGIISIAANDLKDYCDIYYSLIKKEDAISNFNLVVNDGNKLLNCIDKYEKTGVMDTHIIDDIDDLPYLNVRDYYDNSIDKFNYNERQTKEIIINILNYIMDDKFCDKEMDMLKTFDVFTTTSQDKFLKPLSEQMNKLLEKFKPYIDKNHDLDPKFGSVLTKYYKKLQSYSNYITNYLNDVEAFNKIVLNRTNIVQKIYNIVLKTLDRI